MTCSQLEVTSDCVCAQPKREHLVHEFDGDYHRIRDVVTGVVTMWAPSSQLVYFCGYVGVCSGQTLPLGIYTAQAYVMFAARYAVITQDDIDSGTCFVNDDDE